MGAPSATTDVIPQRSDVKLPKAVATLINSRGDPYYDEMQPGRSSGVPQGATSGRGVKLLPAAACLVLCCLGRGTYL